MLSSYFSKVFIIIIFFFKKGFFSPLERMPEYIIRQVDS